MKRLAVLLALFCSGLLVSSFALADDGGKGKNRSASTSTSTTGSKKCRNVSLKGTAGATAFTITVEKSNKAARDLKGKPVSLTFSGKVSVNARMCSSGTSAAAASTFELRNLKVAKAKAKDDD